MKDTPMTLQSIQINLKLAGVKCTDSAVEVFKVLSESESPLSIPEIKAKLQTETHLATIYRILDKLEKASAVNKLQFNEQKSLYELRKLPHDHFICQNCNKVIDIYLNDEELKAAKDLVEKKYNVNVNGASINFTGICKDC